jgi:hypothetical protein
VDERKNTKLNLRLSSNKQDKLSRAEPPENQIKIKCNDFHSEKDFNDIDMNNNPLCREKKQTIEKYIVKFSFGKQHHF